MGNYATVAQFRARIDYTGDQTIAAQLARTTNTTQQAVFMETFLKDADGIIDSRVGKTYTVPITTAADNAFLRALALDIAMYEIFKRGSGDEGPSKYRKNYEDVIATLEDIATGEIIVPDASAKIQNSSVVFASDDPKMDEDSLEFYQ